MPWREAQKVELRRMFVQAVESESVNISQACREFSISRVTGYKWLGRYRREGVEGLFDRSRRPHRVRYATDPAVKELLVADRRAHPRWGARKLCERLEMKSVPPPPERTANRILGREGLIEARRAPEEEPKRFQRTDPNALWQMDHKSAIHGRWFRRAVPFVVLDDCTRYLLGLRSLPDKGLDSTWLALWDILGEFGLPNAILSDNEYTFHGPAGPSHLEVRLLRLDIDILHGRPYHPQTQGKAERLNGTLQRELLNDSTFASAQEIQPSFDHFRYEYNFERPHEAIGMRVPGALYRPSPRRRPEKLPEMEYPPGAVLRSVQKDGWISWKGRRISVGVGLCGQRVEVRQADCGLEVYFGRHRLLGVSENDPRTPARRPRKVVVTTC